MDGCTDNFLPLDTSTIAGRITNIIARRHEAAVDLSNHDEAARFDVSLDTIYFASLLLTVVNGSGETRERRQLLAALDTVEDVVAELRAWIGGTTR